MGALPRGTVVKKPVVTKLWVNGRATENREEWCEEVRLHCERSFDGKSETSEKQAERIRVQRCRSDCAVAIQGRRVQITVNRFVRAGRSYVANPRQGGVEAPVLCWPPPPSLHDATESANDSALAAENEPALMRYVMGGSPRSFISPFLDLYDTINMRTTATSWNIAAKYSCGELLFSLAA